MRATLRSDWGVRYSPLVALKGTARMKRRIPATMATQHPDNACVPFWKRNGDAFVSVAEELEECVTSFRDLGVSEFMWDWEGKYADEAVIEKLLSTHFEYFKKHQLGKDKCLTFRLPNVWKEKGYSLIRALMVVLTSEDVAHDLNLKTRPLFEAILPMTETAEQIMYIHESFEKLARFKSSTFNHHKNKNSEYLSLIPLIEGVDDQMHVKELLNSYVKLHVKHYGKKPEYMRPFLARSDPALLSGFIPNVLANKIALSDIYMFGKEKGVPMFPWIGAGSLVFRGGLNPRRVAQFVDEYRGIRTVTIQSAFRYDYPLSEVRRAIQYLEKTVPKSQVHHVGPQDSDVLKRIITRFSSIYRETVAEILPDLEPLFAACPKRRERRQHTGLLAYKRQAGNISLPRAISFSASCYSLGIPPEFIGLGRALSSLSKEEAVVLRKYYRHVKRDVVEAGRYLNRENLAMLTKRNHSWKLLDADIRLTEDFFGVHFTPKSKDELLHRNLSSQLFLRQDEPQELTSLIIETGKLRRSIG